MPGKQKCKERIDGSWIKEVRYAFIKGMVTKKKDKGNALETPN